MNKFEAYENGSGGIILYLFDGDEVKEVFKGWEFEKKGGLLDGINQLAENPDAWEDWSGDLLDRVGGHRVIDKVDEESGMVIADHFELYTAEEVYQEDAENSNLIAAGRFGVFTCYLERMGANGLFAFGIDD